MTSLLNVSAREALEKFGIKRLSQHAEEFKEASKKVQKLQTKNECYMILEQNAYLSRIGVDEKQFIGNKTTNGTSQNLAPKKSEKSAICKDIELKFGIEIKFGPLSSKSNINLQFDVIKTSL